MLLYKVLMRDLQRKYRFTTVANSGQECLTTTNVSKALNRSLVSLSALIMNNHLYKHNSLTLS